jgi:hypothetical protein
MSARVPITVRNAKPLIPGRRHFFDLPGELRNQIYDIILEIQYEQLPSTWYLTRKSYTYKALLRTCSQVYHELRNYLAANPTGYSPFMMVGRA